MQAMTPTNNTPTQGLRLVENNEPETNNGKGNENHG